VLHTFWRAPHPHVDALWHQVLQQRLLHREAVVHVDQGWAVQQRVAVMANTNLRQATTHQCLAATTAAATINVSWCSMA
jgi:hypothetical protein